MSATDATEKQQRIDEIKAQIQYIKSGMTSCTENVEKQFKLMELEDELAELQRK